MKRMTKEAQVRQRITGDVQVWLRMSGDKSPDQRVSAICSTRIAPLHECLHQVVTINESKTRKLAQ